MRQQIAAVAVVVLVSFAGRSAWGQTQYTVTDLGTLPGGTSSVAYRYQCQRAGGGLRRDN